MKAQKIIATIVAIAISSAGFAKEIATRPNAVQASKSFNSKVFDVDNSRKIQAVELSKQEMQETEGEFLPLVAIGLGAIAFGMWMKHGESYAKTGEPASIKEVTKAGAIDGATAVMPGGAAVGTVKKAKTAVTVGKAVTTTNKVTTATKTTVTTTNKTTGATISGGRTSLLNNLNKSSTTTITTQNGINITGFTKHGLNRAIERNVSTKSILESLKKPLQIKDIKVDSLGRKSQRFIGSRASSVVNPSNGKIVSVNPTSTQKRNSFGRKK